MSKKILVVDDEGDVLVLLRSRLEANGFEVEECSNGGEAVEKVFANKYAAVLLDYFMPSLKGDAVCEEIRANEKYKDLPIIVMTAHSDKEEDFFKEHGATAVLYKPLNSDELLDTITQHAAP